jgi:hypothetical protein
MAGKEKCTMSLKTIVVVRDQDVIGARIVFPFLDEIEATPT